MLDLTICPAPASARWPALGVQAWNNLDRPLLPQVEAAIAVPGVTLVRVWPNKGDDLTGCAEALAKARRRFWLTTPYNQITDPVECAVWATETVTTLDPAGKLFIGVEAANEAWHQWPFTCDLAWHRRFFGEFYSRTGRKLIVPTHHWEQLRGLADALGPHAGAFYDVHWYPAWEPADNLDAAIRDNNGAEAIEPFRAKNLPLIIGESCMGWNVGPVHFGLQTAMGWLGCYAMLKPYAGIAAWHWHGDGIGIKGTPMCFALLCLAKLQRGKPLDAGIEPGNGLYALASTKGAIIVNCGLTCQVRVRGKRIASIAWLTADDVSNAWTLAECKQGYENVKGQTVTIRTGINWVRWA